MHLHLATGDHRHLKVLCHVIAVFEASPLVVPQQPADADPDPPFAPPCQLLEMNGLVVGVIRQQDEQAAFEVKDHVAQMHTVFAFAAAAARATDEP